MYADAYLNSIDMEKKLIRNITEDIFEWLMNYRFNLGDVVELHNKLCENQSLYPYKHITELSDFAEWVRQLPPEEAFSVGQYSHFDLPSGPTANIQFVVNDNAMFSDSYFLVGADENVGNVDFLSLYDMANAINTARDWGYADLVSGLADFIKDLIREESDRDGVVYSFRL